MKISASKYWQFIKKGIPSNFLDAGFNSYLKLRSETLQGNKFYCPVCETTHEKFISNCCPRCNSSVRHRTFFLFLKKRTEFFEKRLKVLHFAPEFCFNNKFKKLNNLDYLTADFNAPRAMEKMDMMHIPYPDNHFDVSFSIDVLDDVPDDIKAIKELERVLKPGGWGIHLAPISNSLKITLEDAEVTKDPEKRLKDYGGYANFRRYGKDYGDRLGSQGFIVEIFKTSDFCNTDEIIRMDLRNDFKIFLLKKK